MRIAIASLVPEPICREPTSNLVQFCVAYRPGLRLHSKPYNLDTGNLPYRRIVGRA